jgi:hypothetical protein
MTVSGIPLGGAKSRKSAASELIDALEKVAYGWFLCDATRRKRAGQYLSEDTSDA